MVTTKDTDIDTLRKDIDALSAAVKTLTEDIGKAAKTNGASFTERAGEKLDAAGAEAGRLAHKVADRGRAAADSVADVARERPFQSMLVAFGVGLVAAKLLDRR